MKCQDCGNEMIKILGEYYCPHCTGSKFRIRKHIRIAKDYSKSLRAILWGVATSLALVVFFIFIRPYLLPQNTDTSLMVFVLFGLISLGVAGFVISFIDKENYVSDSFIVGAALAVADVIWKVMYDASLNPISSFFSSFLVFSLTILLGSFWLFFVDEPKKKC